MKHTPGRLEHSNFHEFQGNKSQLYCEITPIGEFAIIGYVFDPKKGSGAGEGRANAQHLVDCWNACEGLNPKAVPGTIKKLLTENVILLEALKEITEAYGCECLDNEPQPHCSMCNARQAIALAEPTT